MKKDYDAFAKKLYGISGCGTANWKTLIPMERNQFLRMAKYISRYFVKKKSKLYGNGKRYII